MRRALTLIATLTIVFLPSTTVRADHVGDRTALISGRLHALWLAGVPDAARFAAVEREFGIDVLSAPGRIEAQDTNNEVVAMATPTVWYDGFARYPYGASASFKWKYTCGKNKDEACWLRYGGADGEGNVGGDDGFALKIDTPVKTQGGGLMLDPNCNDKPLFYDQPSDVSEYGVGYHRPDPVDFDPGHCGDKSDNREYTWDSGSVGTNFAIAEPCRRPRLFVTSKFGHTWKKTSVTGFGISADGISIQWENEGQNFDSFPNEQGYVDCHY
jgi:hypothetical protein